MGLCVSVCGPSHIFCVADGGRRILGEVPARKGKGEGQGSHPVLSHKYLDSPGDVQSAEEPNTSVYAYHVCRSFP